MFSCVLEHERYIEGADEVVAASVSPALWTRALQCIALASPLLV